MTRKRKAVEIETESEHKVSDEPVRKKHSRYCIAEGCYVTAYFGIHGQKATHCGTHMDKSCMENVKDKRCEHAGCQSINPAYGYLGESPRFCKDHQLPNMDNLKIKKCQFKGCKVMYPQWGYVGVAERCCAGHKTKDMICFVNRTKCEKEGCKVTPYFNYKGFPNGRFRKKHKKKNMYNVQQVTCKYPGCTSQSRVFNFKGLKGLYCRQHKIKGMVNIKSTCVAGDCIIPCRKWGFPGSFGQFRDEHKDESMISFKKVRRTCQFVGCKLTPKFGFKKGRALFCSSHQKPNMKRFEKTCSFDGCEKTRLKFGNHITGRAFCAQHADRSKHWNLTTCKGSRCQQIATHSETGAFPFTFCESHSPDGFSSDNNVTHIPEFTRREIQVITNGTFFLTSLKYTFYLIVSISQVDVALIRVLIEETACIFTTSLQLSGKTFRGQPGYSMVMPLDTPLDTFGHLWTPLIIRYNTIFLCLKL